MSVDPESQPTGKIYEIRTVEDFVAVPVERLDVCLEEFAAWLGMRKLSNVLSELVEATPESIGVFRWADDGQGEMRVRMQLKGTGEEIGAWNIPLRTKGK